MQGAWIWSLVGEDPTCCTVQSKKRERWNWRWTYEPKIGEATDTNLSGIQTKIGASSSERWYLKSWGDMRLPVEVMWQRWTWQGSRPYNLPRLKVEEMRRNQWQKTERWPVIQEKNQENKMSWKPNEEGILRRWERSSMCSHMWCCEYRGVRKRGRETKS